MMPMPRRGTPPSLWEDPVASMEERFNRLMRRLWEERGAEGLDPYPADLYEDDFNVYLEVELPGFRKDEIEINYESGAVTISAERKTPLREGSKQHLTERCFTRVQRRFTLPAEVDEANAAARLEDGVLYITLKKRQETQRRKIEIV